MNTEALVAKVVRHCGAYFIAINEASREGRFTKEDGTPARPTYPTMLLVCETPTHFVAELLGASTVFESDLRVVRRSLPSLESVLGRFPAVHTSSLMNLEGRSTGCSLSTLALMSQRSQHLFQERYPEFPDLHETVLVSGASIGVDEAFHPLAFNEELQDLWLIDVMLVADWQNYVRARYFQTAFILNRAMSSSELQRQLNARHPIGRDTTLLAPSTDENRSLLLTAASFASLATVDRIGETTITHFLESNASLLKTALGGAEIIPQPLLEWLEGNPDPEEAAIQPDFLLIDDARNVHLCEVKLPLLERRSLTTGGHKRRRFVNAVTDGIAQLANYREYLSFESHRQLLADRYRVNVENPRSILIVGSAENYDPEEVRQARRWVTSLELVDYDTLRALYLVRSGYLSKG